MPIRDLENKVPRPPIIGKVRLGVFGTSEAGGKARPRQSDTLVFTSVNKDTLGPIQERYGGEVEEYTPQNSEGEEWRLISASDSLDFLFPFPDAGLNYDSNYEMWGQSGLKRLCDGYDARVFQTVGGGQTDRPGDIEMVERSCICQAQGTQECEPTTRLFLFLPYVPGLGVWELKTGSKWALYELHDVLTFLKSQFEGRMHKLPLRLLYAPKKMRYFDEKQGKQRTTTKRVLSLNLTVPLASLLPEELPYLPPKALLEGEMLAQEAEATVAIDNDPKARTVAIESAGVEDPQSGGPSTALPAPPPSAPADAYERFTRALTDITPPGEEKRAQNIALVQARQMFGVDTTEVPPDKYDELLEACIQKLWPEDGKR